MNLPNKITLSRIIITIIIVIILLFPFDSLGISSIKLFINEAIVVDIKYFIAGILFVIAAFSDLLDGYVARKFSLVTDSGKMLDAIADKFLISTVLIILASQGLINPLIAIIIVARDTIVDAIKMIVLGKQGILPVVKSGKYKTAFLMLGIILTLFNNLPFELINLKFSDVILIIATVLAVYSGMQYYQLNKKYITK